MKVDGEQTADSAVKRPRGRPSLRGERRDQLIQGATVLFNSQGISAISIAEIAEKLQLARASVYHYVKDRKDLVRQCYIKSCEQTADDLLEAAAAPSGLERLTQFVEIALAPERPPVAVLSEINSLDESIADVVRHAHNRNIAALRRFITMGVADGSMKPCDDEVVAQAIFGILSWSQLLPHWSSTQRMARLRASAATTVIDIIRDGLATNRDQSVAIDVSVDRFQQETGDLFDRAEASRIKTERVLAAASRLFNRTGIDATSLDEISLDLGVTKGVLYHYLQDKSDLVVKCYERAFALQEKFIAVSQAEGNNGLEAALINAHLNIQAKSSAIAPLMPQPGFGSLPEADQARFRRIANRQNKTVADFLQSGIDDGLVRPCHAPLVTHVCAGAFGWIPKWRHPDDPRSAQNIADQICDLVFNGIARNTSTKRGE